MKESAVITYENLRISNYEMIHIEEFEMMSTLNEHAVMKLTGLIAEGTGEIAINQTMIGQAISVYSLQQNDKTFIYRGFVSDINASWKDGVTRLVITALSTSHGLDVKMQSQSFQNTGMTYQAMMDTVLQQCPGATAVYTEEFKKAIGEFCIQYKETAWEYIKRMASRFYHGIYPNILSISGQVMVGKLNQQVSPFEVIEFDYHKDIQRFECDRDRNIAGISERDYLIYEVTSYDILRIGDKVQFENKELYVRKAQYRLEQGILCGYYTLCTAKGMAMPRIENEKLRGISINGTTKEVVRDKVKIQLQIDEEPRAEYLFPYSTISASPDGSGWYCMPEIGDLLRVYFPETKESDCYAISSVSAYTPPDGAGAAGSTAAGGTAAGGSMAAAGDRMADPSIRYLRTMDNKEIKLSPEGITITVDDGKAIIDMDNQGNVVISGTTSIKLAADNDINISAARNISMYAAKNFKISGEGGGIELMENGVTKLTGQYVVEN